MVIRRIKRTSQPYAARLRGNTYGLSREASAVCNDSNNLCRGVNRGQACQGEVSSQVLSQMTNIVFKNSSLMSEEETLYSRRYGVSRQ